MRFRLHNPFRRAHPRTTHEEKASRTAPLIALFSANRPRWTPRDYHALAREGFAKNPIAYRSVRMVAEAAAAIPILLYEGSREHDTHPLLALLRRPNPRQTGADLLEHLTGHLLVSGNAYLERVALDGELRELHVLRPDRMKVVPGAEGWPEAYEYSVAGSSVRFAMHEPPLPPILHLTLFNPLDDHYGMPPLEAAQLALDVHNAASAWNKALLDNAARPSGALVYSAAGGNLSDDQFERLKSELENHYTGAANAGRPLLLEGGLDWKGLSLSPKDMDFVEAKHIAAREIALAFGVPPMLLGIPGDNTYSNYAEANRAFYRQTVLPLLSRVLAGLSNWLAPAYGGEILLEADLDQVPALSAERDQLWKRIGEAAFLSDDEKREAVGYDAAVSGSGGFKFSPDQPRVPAGSREGGQWAGDGASDERVLSDENPDGVTPGAQYAQNQPQDDVLNRHIIDNHVGKTDDELIKRIERETLPGVFVRTGRDRNGTFFSVEAARDFINRTIEGNPTTIARFLQGSGRIELLTLRFGYETGREAILDEQGVIRFRRTYEVGVVIQRDPSSRSGYRVISAYPRNFNPRVGQ